MLPHYEVSIQRLAMGDSWLGVPGMSGLGHAADDAESDAGRGVQVFGHDAAKGAPSMTVFEQYLKAGTISRATVTDPLPYAVTGPTSDASVTGKETSR
ncbi:MAG: hypothetical protein IMZ71_03140 [Chloroflexi bacterium]|nr:hypothetical protein [Chloroflexota bacterium]